MRHPLFTRLRPFLHRDLRYRLTTAMITIVVLSGLAWLGVSALSNIDSYSARQTRIDIGLERQRDANCGHDGLPECIYGDEEQAILETKVAQKQLNRVVILKDLMQRIAFERQQLRRIRFKLTSDTHSAGAPSLALDALQHSLRASVVDLRPAPIPDAESRTERLLWPINAIQPVSGANSDDQVLQWRWQHRGRPGTDLRTALLQQLDSELAMLEELSGVLVQRIDREGRIPPTTAVSRETLLAQLNQDILDNVQNEVASSAFDEEWVLANWLTNDQHDEISSSATVRPRAVPATMNSGLAQAIQTDPAAIARLVNDAHDQDWANTWSSSGDEPIPSAYARYVSPVTVQQQARLFGTALFGLAAFMLLVVAPMVTATSTAREREAGTLPILRMTGLSAIDLALAMSLGSNIYAIVTAGGLLAIALPALVISGSSVTLPLLTLAALVVATNVSAVGVGDALGHRVNASVVGALTAAALIGPGFIGALMILNGWAATGYLLGPIPAALSTIFPMGLPMRDLVQLNAAEYSPWLFGYTIAFQVILGAIALVNWQRRVEQAWLPLFRPLDGILLALLSIGCSALAVIDMSQQLRVNSYDEANFVTIVAASFLVPILGWLLVSSLIRPARASANTTVEQARAGLLRFQGFLLLGGIVLVGTYVEVLRRAGMDSQHTEVMWATITHCVFIAETIAATLLAASRWVQRRAGILAVGGIVVLLQTIAGGMLYSLEVEYVAVAKSAIDPFSLAASSSAYWLVFLVLLWASGLGLILAALLRERDRLERAHEDDERDENGDDESPNRWLH